MFLLSGETCVWLIKKHNSDLWTIVELFWGLWRSPYLYLALHPHWDCKTPLDYLLFQTKIWNTAKIENIGDTQPNYVSSWCNFRTHSAKALLLVFVGKNSVVGTKAEEFGGDSGWLSENWRGRWLVICGASALLGSVEKESTRLPNRPWVRCKTSTQAGIILNDCPWLIKKRSYSNL